MSGFFSATTVNGAEFPPLAAEPHSRVLERVRAVLGGMGAGDDKTRCAGF